MPRGDLRDADSPEETTRLLDDASGDDSSMNTNPSEATAQAGEEEHLCSEHPPAAAAANSATESLEAPTSSNSCKNLVICRICLEEDSSCNLDTPCACSGTQRFAHQACIQRWVEEKGNTRCEICGQEYNGDYTAPLPPAVSANGVPMLTPIYIMGADSSGGGPTHRQMQLIDEVEDYGHQHPGINCFFTACVFVLFLVVLQHTSAAGNAGSEDGGAGFPALPSPSPPPPGSLDPMASADDFTLVLLWLASKAIFIAIPIWTIMRVAQRQAEQRHMEEMMRSPFDVNSRVVVRMHRPRGADAV